MTQLDTQYYLQPQSTFDDEGKQTIWSSSYITVLQQCKRKYFYQTIQGWHPKQKSIDLTFGGFFSASVEMYWKLRFKDNSHNDALYQVVEAVMQETKKYTVFQTEELKTRKALVRAIIDYFDTYNETDIDEVTTAEQKFNILVADDIIFVGKLDLIKQIEDHVNILDQKTTRTNLSPTWFKVWTPNNQMSMYLFAGQMIFPYPVHHIILDAVQIQKTGTKLMRGIVSRTRDELDDWVAGVIQEIQFAWQQDPNDERAWPQNPNACGYFKGCEFRDICSSSPKFRQAYLKQNFKNVKDEDVR